MITKIKIHEAFATHDGEWQNLHVLPTGAAKRHGV